MRRLVAVVAVLLVAVMVLVPSLAEARAGGGSSMGSRGGRTFSAPSSTPTAPGMATPFNQTMTPRPSYGGGTGTPAFGRSGGFGSGFLGGLLGAGIGGLLFGRGFFGGGGFGFIGLLLQLALLYFIAKWLFRLFARPAMVGSAAGGGFARFGMPAGGMGAAAPPRQPAVSLSPSDYHAFEQLLQEVQAAWSSQDLRRLQLVATPEMVGYFNEQLAQMASRGLVNSVTQVRLDQGDLSEAWSEGEREYATVAMRFSMIDVTRDSTGQIVEGNPETRVPATELWTFVRSRGGHWILSAIQQTK